MLKEVKKMKTLKNKLYALLFVALGVAALAIDNDCTVLVLISIFAVPMFLARENIFDD